jgi:hypothetical protein
MPEHSLHIEYCLLAGLTDVKALKAVNDVIDFPNFRARYRNFRQEMGIPLPTHRFNHNLARKHPTDAEMDVRYLETESPQFRIAYFLHHYLDLFSEHQRESNRSISECRRWARQEMNLIFGNLLHSADVKEGFVAAETFFLSPESESFLQELPMKRKELKMALKNS